VTLIGWPGVSEWRLDGGTVMAVRVPPSVRRWSERTPETTYDWRGPRLALAVALLISISAIASGCDSIDPTVQFFRINLKNDLGRQVRLADCDDTRCHDRGDSWSVTSGALTDDTISDRGVTTAWLVTTPSRSTRFGCIVLNFKGRWNNVVVLLSQIQPCTTAKPLSIQQVHHGSHQGGET
jgi:hypothetical protein